MLFIEMHDLFALSLNYNSMTIGPIIPLIFATYNLSSWMR
jgi:hypothetical protein